jgi:bacteriorhodopsin
MSSAFEKRGNDALRVNPDNGYYTGPSDINITTHGSDWYWAVTAVMAISTLIFVGLSFTVPRRARIFHYITAAITMTASIAYFTMASNLGYTAIRVEFGRSDSKVAGLYREIFYVRYIDWVITTPLLLLDLLLTAGLPWPTVLWTIFLDEVMIVTGLVGALVASDYKWGYFVFAMVALFGIAHNIMIVGRSHATVIGPDVSRVFLMCGVLTTFLWFLYPIAWGVSEGGNIIAPDSEAVFYGVLDIFAKPVFGAMLILGHRNIDPARLGLAIRDYDEPIGEKGYGNNTGVTGARGNTTTAGTGNGVGAGDATTGAHPATSTV